MAAPISPSLTTDPNLTITKDQNVSLNKGNISVSAKTAYFKLGVGASRDQSLIEMITKDSKQIGVNSEINVSTSNPYYVQTIDKTAIKFGSGTPLISQSTNIRFPSPEAKTYTPEKVATFLIFKK
jgi:hypothetical protein